MTDEPIFICDPPPAVGWIIACERELTVPELDNLRKGVLGPGMKVEIARGGEEWPNAEFCTA